MEALWLRKREEQTVAEAEAKAVQHRLRAWASGRARREEELQRKIEASRFGVHGATFFAETTVPAAALLRTASQPPFRTSPRPENHSAAAVGLAAS
jgi:hypothetical protein